LDWKFRKEPKNCSETVGFRDIVGPQGKVIAVEPFPANVSALRGLVALNGWTNVEVLPLAIGEQAGIVSFMPPPDDHSTGVGHIAPASGGDGGSAQTIQVECATLDSLVAHLGSVRAVFCDTEGAELMVLKGARSVLREHQPALVIEASPKLLRRAGTSLETLRGLLRDAGYRPFVIDRLGVSPAGDPLAPNAANWLCLPEAQTDMARRCARMIRACALLPCVRGVNPLCR